MCSKRYVVCNPVCRRYITRIIQGLRDYYYFFFPRALPIPYPSPHSPPSRISLRNPGHWISASTIIPTVPYVYGEGEPGPSSTSLPSNGSGPTCTLGRLTLAVSGRECRDEAFDPSAAVRPLRARLSALANTVAKGQMPTVVLVAGFAPASKAVQSTAENEKRKETGAVRARGRWAALGENHLRWEFETVNVDLGGDRIVKVGAEAFRGQGGVAEEGSEEGGRNLYEFFLDQDMFIMAWKGDSPRAEGAVVFVRDEIPRRF